MSFIAEARRNNLWFGTEEYMRWMPTPNRGASTGGSGWAAEGTLLNGGGFQLNSFGSHRQYVFEWPGSSSARVAQTMKSFADGSFGRGLIYFLDPLIYKTNIFPAMWADPSMGVGQEGATLVYGLEPTALPTPAREANDLPVKSAYYNLATVGAGWRGKEDAVFLPIPEGHLVALGAIYSFTGTGGVYFRTQTTSGALGTIQKASALPTTTQYVAMDTVVNTGTIAGVWVWVGRSSTAASSVTISALTARVLPASEAVTPSPSGFKTLEGPWVGGQGHSGCAFIGKPTEIKNGPFNGGQVGFAASFREIGSWLYG